MALSVQATLVSEVQFPDGPKTYTRELPDDRMLFVGDSGPFEIRAKDYARGLSQGTLLVLSAPGEEPEGPPQTIGAIVPPNTSEKKLLEAKTRHFYVIKCDVEGIRTNRGRKLERLLKATKSEAHSEGLTAEVTLRMLQSDLKKGTPDNRPLSLFVSQRGNCGGRSLHPAARRFMKHAVGQYWSNAKLSITDCFATFINLVEKENNNLAKTGEELIEYSKNSTTFYRYIHAAKNYESVDIRDKKIVADTTFRGSQSTRRAEAPLDTVLVDHTVLDVHVVDESSKHVLGRPILSIAVCSYSLCIVEYVISFQPPSRNKLLALVKSIVCDKYHYRDLVPGIPRDIEEYGLPNTIVLDRALENLSSGAKELCKGLGINIEWAPPRNGAYKVDVERAFGILNQAIFHHLPGSVAHSPTKMRELQLNPAKCANLTMAALEKILITAIVDYQHSPHRPLYEVPAEKFQAGLRHSPRRLPSNIRLLDDLLQLRGTARLWRKGIEFRGLRYRNPAATTELLDASLGRQLSRGRSNPRNKNNSITVDILYNPDDCSEISIIGNVDGRPSSYKFPSTFGNYTRNLSFSEHKAIISLLKKQGNDKKNEADLLSARGSIIEFMHALHLLNDKFRKAEGRQIIERHERQEAELRRNNQSQWEKRSEHRRTENRKEALIVDPPMGSGPVGAAEPPGAARGRAKAAKTKKANDAARATVQRLTKGPDPQPLLFDDDEAMPSFLNRKAKS